MAIASARTLCSSTCRRATLVVLMAVAVLASAGHAHATNACVGGKEKCVAQKVKALLGCHAKAEGKGVAVDPVCVAKASAKFDGGATPAKGCFEKLEAKYAPASAAPCVTFDDTTAVAGTIDAFVDAVVLLVDPTYPAPVLNKCAAGKKKCVAKRAQGLLGCHAKAATAGALDPVCVAKVSAKFDGGTAPAKGCIEKLETKHPPGSETPCLTFDDTASLASAVDAFVADVVCDLDPASGTCEAVPTPTPTPTGAACGGLAGPGGPACAGTCPAGQFCRGNWDTNVCECMDASTCMADAFCFSYAGCASCPSGYSCSPPDVPLCVYTGSRCDADCECPSSGECAVVTFPTPGPTPTSAPCGFRPIVITKIGSL